MSNTSHVFGPYWNGAAWVFADPVELWRRLQQATSGNLKAVVEDSRSEEDMVAFPAIEQLMPAVREAFRMTPFNPADGKGATERDCNAALNGYFRFLNSEKKSPD